jgi:hypothetical protein
MGEGCWLKNKGGPLDSLLASVVIPFDFGKLQKELSSTMHSNSYKRK